MKKIIAGFMIISLVLAVSCSKSGGGNISTTTDAQNQNAQESLPDDEPQNLEEVRILPDIPEADFEGYVYTILTLNGAIDKFDLTSEEETGDVIGDAVYQRNRAVEEAYNIEITEINLPATAFNTALKNEVSSGSNDYDLISPRVIDSAAYMQEGYFLNLFNVPNIDLKKPWYDQNAVREMSIGNKLFIVLSDILLSDNDSTTITIFNKQLIQDYDLEDPYALVKSGKWTIDKLYEMAKATAKDLNGDGMMTPDTDQYGYLTWNDAMITYLHAGGQRLVGKDAADLPVLTFNNEKTYAIMEKVMDLLYDENVTGNVQKADFKNSSFERVFTNNRAAFGWVRLYMISNLRAMDTDFGILPMPKIYESSELYQSTVNVHTSSALSIPVTAEDINRTTIIMEAMAAESRYTLEPAYYEISLKAKHSRDDESSEMLDLILSNRVIDIGDVYNFANFALSFYDLAGVSDRNLVSFYEKNEGKVNTAIESMIEKFSELD